MDPFLTITVPGVPVPKGRPRFANGHTYTPERTASYERELAILGSVEMEFRDPLTTPVRVEVEAVFPVPESWSKGKKALSPALAHMVRADVDNILKIVGDGLNKIVWADDRQIVGATVTKNYGDIPKLIVRVFIANQI